MTTDTQVRVLHGLLTRLGIESPFGTVLERQAAAENLRIQAAGLAEESRRRRREIAAALVAGDAKLDRDLVDEYQRTRLVFVSPNEQSVADILVDQAVDLARSATGAALHGHAEPLFRRLRAEVEEVVAGLHALPAPPRNLWADPAPDRALARDPRHAETLSRLALLAERWFTAQQAVKIVREPAGHGYHTFGDAPRDAATWRNWTKVLDGRHEMKSVPRSLRLWWATVEADWQPGCWTAADLGGPVRLSFAERLAKLGSAVTGGVARG